MAIEAEQGRIRIADPHELHRVPAAAGGGADHALRWQLRGIVLFRSTAPEHYAIAYGDEAGTWQLMDDTRNGAVARRIDADELRGWCGPREDGWAPVMALYGTLRG